MFAESSKAFIFQKFAVKVYFGLSRHIFQHGSSLSLENVCESWCMHLTGFSSAAVVPLDCEQSLIFLCKVTAGERKAASREKRGRKPEKKKISFSLVIITSWFAIVLDEIRTRRI